MQQEVVKFIDAKGKNKRIQIILYDFKEKGKVFRVSTKTLVSFERREIITTDNSYSIETLFILKELLMMFFSDSEVSNKILLKEINAIGKFNVATNLKK